MRRLAEGLGISHTWVRKALMVAQLPPVVVSAFRSPIEIQPKHAEAINAALDVDRKAVLRLAESLRTDPQRLGPQQVVDRLVTRPSDHARKNEMRVGGHSIGTFKVDRKGRTTIVLDPPGAGAPSIDAVLEALTDALRPMLAVRHTV